MSIPRDVDWIQYSFLLAGERIELSSELRQYRRLSSADFKYQGSGLGEDTVINPRPQFTPFADIRRPGLWASSGGNVKTPTNIASYFTGMGRAYSEMFHDNRQTVHIRFGVTQYKGLLTFFTGFYDHDAAILARQGRASISYYFGYLAGSIATLWLPAFILVGQGIKYLLGRTSSSYMSLKPTMPLYWLRANTIMNNFGSNLGIIARTFDNTGAYSDANTEVKDAKGNKVNSGGASDLNDLRENQQNQDYVDYLKRLMPGILDRNGQIDLQKTVNQGVRRQLEWNNRVSNLSTATGSNSGLETYKAMVDALSRPLTGKGFQGTDLFTYLSEYHKGVVGSIENRNLDSDAMGDKVEAAIASGDQQQLRDLAAGAAAGDGGGAAVADATGDTGAGGNYDAATAGNVAVEQSATAESQVEAGAAGVTTGIDPQQLRQDLLKAKPAEMLTVVRPADGQALTDEEKVALQQNLLNNEDKGFFGKRFEIVKGWLSDFGAESVAEWNRGSAFLNLEVNYTGAGSMNLSNATKETTISGTMKGVSGAARDTRISASDFKTGFGFVDAGLQMVGDMFGGALDSVKMSGLMALAGNAFTVFPKQWDDTTVTVPTANFTIELRSFTGNDVSNYMHLYPTIACLLAGALPLGTGPQSYTAPFVCEAYSRGAFAIRYGIISSLSIRHGVGNLGYNDNRRPIAFEIDVEIADLSSMYHMSVSNGASPVNIFKRVFDDDNAFNDYLSTITGLDLNDMIDPRRKLSLRMATQMANVRSWWSPTQVASRAASSTPINVLNKIFGPSTFPGM